MQKNPTHSGYRLTLLLSLLLTLCAACGTSFPSSNTTIVPTVPAGENIYVLDGYGAQSKHLYEPTYRGPPPWQCASKRIRLAPFRSNLY